MIDRLTNESNVLRALLALCLVAGCKSSTEPRNDPPTAQVLQPVGVLTVAESAAVVFKGSATDPEDGPLTGAALTWSSNLDGPLGTGDSIQITTLSAGSQVITLTATDSKGLTGTATVSITVTPFVPGNQPPQVSISSPAQGGTVNSGNPVTLAGTAIDPEDGSLSGGALVWTSSVDGPLGTGTSVTVDSLSTGSHDITLTATDNDGLSASATLSLTVVVTQTLGLDTLAMGLSEPLFLTAPPGDTGRVFIVEQTGAIRIVEHGQLLTTPFLDLGDSVNTGGEQGLLGLAFDPQYASNGRFYVSYTADRPAGDTGGRSVLARYTVSGLPNVADPNSGFTLLTVNQPYDNHNGGGLGFGPDNYLYYALGDGGSGGDPQNHGQDRTDLLGSLLRLDVSGGGPYAIPASNPYAMHATFRRELWNWGLRNPWRWSFDRQTGDLYIGDVGQGQHEEVDVQAAASAGGENYGWRIMEGLNCYSPSTGCNQTGLTLPVIAYDHSPGGHCSITGGYVYRGSALPSVNGVYFYADYCSGVVWSFRLSGGVATEQTTWPSLHPPTNQVTSFGQDARGELYMISGAGIVYRIVAR